MHQPTLFSAAFLFASIAASPATLISHWNFDESTGTTAANAANPALPGTVAGGALWVAGPSGFGSALAFDGVDDQVNTTFATLTGSAARTVTAWVKYPNQVSATPNEFDAIFSFGNNTTSNRWTMRLSDSLAIAPFQLRLEVAGGGVNGTTLLNDDRWHHVAVVQSGNTLASISLYVDGIAETLSYNGGGAATAINTVIGATTQGRIGASGHATNYNILGSIDDVRVYDEALSASQIQQLMVPVPEPSTAAISAAALGLLLRRRRS